VAPNGLKCGFGGVRRIETGRLPASTMEKARRCLTPQVRFDARADLNSAVIMNRRDVPIAAQRPPTIKPLPEGGSTEARVGSQRQRQCVRRRRRRQHARDRGRSVALAALVTLSLSPLQPSKPRPSFSLQARLAADACVRLGSDAAEPLFPSYLFRREKLRPPTLLPISEAV
jgi:hypothetical protein